MHQRATKVTGQSSYVWRSGGCSFESWHSSSKASRALARLPVARALARLLGPPQSRSPEGRSAASYSAVLMHDPTTLPEGGSVNKFAHNYSVFQTRVLQKLGKVRYGCAVLC